MNSLEHNRVSSRIFIWQIKVTVSLWHQVTVLQLPVEQRIHHGEMAHLSFDLLCNVLVITVISVALKLGVIPVVFTLFILKGSALVSSSRTKIGMSVHLQLKAQT